MLNVLLSVPNNLDLVIILSEVFLILADHAHYFFLPFLKLAFKRGRGGYPP